MKHYTANKQQYLKYYDIWKNYPIDFLDEIRRSIVEDGPTDLNSLKLEVIDDLIYLKQNNIPL